MAHYCLQCGTKLEKKIIEAREREFCPACGWIYYQQPKVSAGCRIEEKDHLLLVKRRNSPFQGTWHFPSGFVEVDEVPSHAAERETKEECGLVVRAEKLAGVYFYDDDSRGNGVVIIYDASVQSGTLRTSDETSDVRFFALEELHTLPLAGMSGAGSVADWMREKENG